MYYIKKTLCFPPKAHNLKLKQDKTEAVEVYKVLKLINRPLRVLFFDRTGVFLDGLASHIAQKKIDGWAFRVFKRDFIWNTL